MHVMLPTMANVPNNRRRLTDGDGRRMIPATVFKAVSFLSNVVLFRAVSANAGSRVGMRASTEITLAGHAATRLFATGGAGGVALTAWALRRSGMGRRDVAARMTTFLVLLYSVYMAALILGGVGLYLGVLPGPAPVGLTLAPAALGAAVIATALALPWIAARMARMGGRLGRLAPGAASLGDGVRTSLRMA